MVYIAKQWLRSSPKDNLLLGNSQGSGQHSDDYTAAASQFPHESLHTPPPVKRTMNAPANCGITKLRVEDKLFHTPSVSEMTLTATISDVFKSLAL